MKNKSAVTTTQSKYIDLIQYTKNCKTLLLPIKAFIDKALDYIYRNDSYGSNDSHGSHGSHESHCVCFDIDETLLTADEDETITRHPFGYALYKYCLKLKIPIILVTARTGSDASKKYLLEQLKTVEINKFEALYMQGREDTDTAIYKQKCRHSIAEKYGNILLSCGDQISDHFANDSLSVDTIFCENTYYAFINYKDETTVLNIKFATDIY
tara:strand:+ start:3271 stop:3906 length:636 start_codon:yes stop_codon:yes gene_type:complete